MDRNRRNRKTNNKLKIIPLGGIGEVGKNMTVIEWGNNILVIDCGLMFPNDDMLGIDYVIPDVTYLEENREKIKAFVITHGHEDHIGATPYVIDKFNVPVYGTKLTMGLVELKMKEQGKSTKMLKRISAGDTVNCGVFSVEFIKVSHSIDDAVGLAIHTPLGTIVHTGDFKIDFTPIDGKVIDLDRFGQLGKEGVLALMSDSTNAENPGYTISEKSVGASFDDYFKNCRGRIIIATFASNVHRLQQVIDLAKRYNRKVCLSGRSMIKIANLATELGYLNLPEKMVLSMDDVDSVRDNKVCILTTGSQGEQMSGLVRMAAGEHSKLSIKQGDTVTISSMPIPGNEKYVSEVINMLYRGGANVIYGSLAKVHVSGHACQEELKMMLALTKPQYFIPVHGEYRHIYNHAALAETMGMKKQNVFISELGREIVIDNRKAVFGDTVSSGVVMIDGCGIGDVGNAVLHDRQLLASDGLFMIIMTVSKKDAKLIAGPDIISRGFVYMKESEGLIDGTKKIVEKIIKENERKKIKEWSMLKGKIKKSVNNYLYENTKRNPMILPIIIQV